MSKKFEITDRTETFVKPDGGEVKVHRIRRIFDGELGGYVEAETNLSQQGLCWIHDKAVAIGEAWVGEDAQVREMAVVMDRAQMTGNSEARGRAVISGGADIGERVVVKDWARVRDATVSDEVVAGGECRITGTGVTLMGNVVVRGKASVTDGACATGEQVIETDLDYDLDEVEYAAWEAEHPNPMPQWATSGENDADIIRFLRETGGQSHAIVGREKLGMLPAGMLDRYDTVHTASLGDELYDNDGRATFQVSGVDVLRVTERIADALDVHSSKTGRGFVFSELREGIREVVQKRSPQLAA